MSVFPRVRCTYPVPHLALLRRPGALSPCPRTKGEEVLLTVYVVYESRVLREGTYLKNSFGDPDARPLEVAHRFREAGGSEFARPVLGGLRVALVRTTLQMLIRPAALNGMQMLEFLRESARFSFAEQ